MLKADLHLHCSDDPKDELPYSFEDLLERAVSLGFNALSLTLHNKLYFPKRYRRLAEEKGVLLVPGVELRLEGADVLVYNVSRREVEQVSKLRHLERLKRKDSLIVAPHPFLPFADSLKEKLEAHASLFDAVEHTFFHAKFFSFWNKKAKRFAERHGLPLIGNGDVHDLSLMGYTYSLVKAGRTVEGVVRAVKKGAVEVVSRPLPLRDFLKIPLRGFHPLRTLQGKLL